MDLKAMSKKKSIKIKVEILSSLSIFLFLIVCPLNISLARTITLKAAIETALKESPVIRAKQQLISSKHEELGEAKGAFLPNIDLYGTYTRTSDPQVVVPIKSFHGTPPTFSRDLYSGGLDIRIPIYEGGRLRSNLKIKELEEALSKEVLNLTQEELAYLIRAVFYQCLYLDTLLEAQEETLSALKRLREDSKKRLEVGRVRPVDLMRIDAQLKDQEAQIINTKEARVRARHLLSRLMGLSPNEDLEPTGALHDVVGREYEIQLADIPKLIEDRPDIKKAIHEVKIKKEAIRLEKGLNYPALDLVGNYGRRAGSGFDSDEEVWNAGIKVNLNIFSGGVITHRIRRARYEYLEKESELKDLKLRAIQEIKDALSKIKEARARIEAKRKAVESARESFRIERLRYETGAGTITDVLLQQAEWLNQKAGLTRALYDLEMGKAELDRALGRTVELMESSTGGNHDKS